MPQTFGLKMIVSESVQNKKNYVFYYRINKREKIIRTKATGVFESSSITFWVFVQRERQRLGDWERARIWKNGNMFRVLCRKLINKRTQRVNWTTFNVLFYTSFSFSIWFILQLCDEYCCLSTIIHVSKERKQKSTDKTCLGH